MMDNFTIYSLFSFICFVSPILSKNAVGCFYEKKVYYLILFLTQEKVFDLHGFGGVLLVTKKGRSALASAKHCQGQLQTTQYVIK
jgi:hypothetical protein